MSCCSWLKREAQLVWLVLKDNVLVSCPPFALVYVLSCCALSLALEKVLLVSAMALVYLLVFDLLNQLVGEEEDRINKPWRAIPSGRLTRRGAIIRLVLYNLLFGVFGLCCNVGWYCFLWQLDVLGYYFGWDKNWFYKNHVFMPVGIFCQIMINISLATHGNYPMELAVFVMKLACFESIPASIQDLRDVKGDKYTDRKTLPVLFGFDGARLCLFIANMVAWPLIYQYALLTHLSGYRYYFVLVTHPLFYFYILYRLATKKNPSEHQTTYLLVQLHYIFNLSTVFYWSLPSFFVSS